jgi:hypothetical protein
MVQKITLSMRWLLVLIFVLSGLAPISAGSRANAASPQDVVIVPAGDPIQIAFATWPGWVGYQDFYDAFQMAVDDYGPIKGFSIQRNDYDDGCSEPTGQDAGNQIITNTQNLAVVGPLCSSSTRGMAPVLETAGVVMISYSNTAPDLGGNGWTVFNRTVIADPEYAAWNTRVSYLPSVLAWSDDFNAAYGRQPMEYAKYVYDATLLLLTRIDQVSTLDGSNNLLVDRATLAGAVRNTADFSGITDLLTLEIDGDRVDQLADSGTRYVALSGDDGGGNTCTDSALPCASVQRASAVANPLESVLVAGGTYTENLTLPISLTIEGGYEPISWTRDINLYETVLHGAGEITAPWDFKGDRYPMVIEDGGVYKMWYTGYSIYGPGRIGYATSPDGVNWTPYASNPVLDLGSPGEWDDTHLEAPFVINEDGNFEMWYMGCDGEACRVGYATSPDGIAWTKYSGNPVIDIGNEFWNNTNLQHPVVLHEDGIYKAWVNTQGDDGSGVTPYFAYATSPDGIAWTWDANNPIFSRDYEGWIWRPFVINEGSNYAMWYGVWDGQARIGYATSPDELTWTRYGDVLEGTPGGWDDGFASDPAVLQISGDYWMWYDNNVSIGVVTSTEGITWTKFLTAPVLSPAPLAELGDPVINLLSDNLKVTLDGLTVTGGDGERAGGIFASRAQLSLVNCLLTGNIAYGSPDAWAGGAVLGGDPLIVDRSRFIDNYTMQDGASALRPFTLQMVNSLVASNHGSPAIHINFSGSLFNVTIADNDIGGVLFNAPDITSTFVITNSILYANGFGFDNPGAGSTQVSYSDVQGGYTGTGNIDLDPLFVDAAAGDYHLQLASPTRDAGTSLGAPLVDLDGKPRDLLPDMGAFEVQEVYRTFLPIVYKN